MPDYNIPPDCRPLAASARILERGAVANPKLLSPEALRVTGIYDGCSRAGMHAVECGGRLCNRRAALHRGRSRGDRTVRAAAAGAAGRCGGPRHVAHDQRLHAHE